MAYTPRTATGAAGNNSTTTGTLPTGVTAGDFLVAKMVVAGGGSTYTQPTLTGVPGWTLIPAAGGSANPLTSQSTSAGIHTAWYYRWATGSDPAPVWTFNASVLFKYCWTIEAYSGGPGSGAPAVYTAAGATGTAVTTNTAPSVTVTAATYYAETYGSRSTTNATYTTPAGTTLRKATFGTGGAAADTLLVDSNGTATGTIGGHTTTGGTAAAWQVSGLILFPNAGSGSITAALTVSGSLTVASPQNTVTATLGVSGALTVSGAVPALFVAPVVHPKYTIQLVDAPHLGSSSAVIGDLSQASGKSLTLSTPEGSTLTWTMPGLHPESLLAGNSGIPGDWEMCADAIFWRDTGTGPVKLWRGRVFGGNDTSDDTGSSITIPWTAVDYKALFASKQLLDGDTLSFAASTDVAAIAWSLISTVQARTNGALGITKSTDGWTGGGTANTGKTFGATFVVTAGTDLQAALNTLLAGDTTAPAGAAAGFDWWLDPDLKIHIKSRSQTAPNPPGRGTASIFVADYGGTVRSFARTPLIDQYANLQRGDGGTGTTPTTVTSPTITTDPRGRVERAITITVNSTQTTAQQNALVAQVTAEALYIGNLPAASYTLVLTTGVWDPAVLGVGDNVQVVIQAGRLNVNGLQRVFTLQIDASDDGDEKVTLTTQRPGVAHWQADALLKLGSRVRGLELRS